MDGLHVARFFERFEGLCRAPHATLGLSPETPADDLDGVLAFLRNAEALKATLRSGYTSTGRQEDVAAHAWRFALMAFVLRDRFPDADPLRLIGMALVHDLGEAVAGDIPAPEQQSGPVKSADERRDLVRLLAPLPEPLRAELLGLYDEYEAAETPTARAAKGLDELETILQHTQGQNPPGFDYRFNLGYGRAYTAADPTIRRLRERLDAETERRALGTEGAP
jgi:putative hydrolase of HD superfamily